MRHLFTIGAIAAVIVAAALWFLSAPKLLPQSAFAGLQEPDLAHGEEMFWAGGCTSCHAAPRSKGDEKLVLSGGLSLVSDFGTFYVPNISTNPKSGIGGWTFENFANSMKQGVDADGRHLFPSFPYTSYTRITMKDLNDLWGFLKTLPASGNVAPDHDLAFPFNIRRAVGLWKLLNLKGGKVVDFADADAQVQRGQYLVEGPGHCGACHTPRDLLGGLKLGVWMSGAKNPDGEGIIPNITPDGGIKGWSAGDISYYLESGFTPDFDTAGGSMVSVLSSIEKLPAADRQAIAAYLKAIPGHPNGYKSK
jgi:mono/diheme cytochrome c family protein